MRSVIVIVIITHYFLCISRGVRPWLALTSGQKVLSKCLDSSILLTQKLTKAIEFLFIVLFICRELPFQKGDIVYIIRQVDQNWYEGEHHGRVGIFPQSYVEVCEFSNNDSMMLSDGFCYGLFLSFLFSFSYFLSQRRPSQRKVSRCRCWSMERQWPASTSVGTLWWKCLLERLERE